jgi:uncharacterized protein YndB with AHSA1/START domain
VGTCEIRYTRYYRASPEEVWAALTQPASLARWLAPVGEIDLRAGGAFELQLDADQPMMGRVRAVEPSRLLELDWVRPGEQPSSVRFELTADDGGTTVVLDHLRIDAQLGMRYLTLWHRHVRRLDALVER